MRIRIGAPEDGVAAAIAARLAASPAVAEVERGGAVAAGERFDLVVYRPRPDPRRTLAPDLAAAAAELAACAGLEARLALDDGGVEQYLYDQLDPAKRVDTNLEPLWVDDAGPDAGAE